MRLIKEVYEDVIERVLERNVVNDLMELMFLEVSTEEELTIYYGGSIDKEALINDTLHNLEGSQNKLKVLLKSKDKFIELYGNNYADDDFGRTPKRTVESGSEQESGSGDVKDNDKQQSSVESPYKSA